MTAPAGFRVTPQVVLGVCIVILGLLMTADNLNWIRAADIIRYWPVAIVLLGLSKIATSDARSGKVTGVAFVVVGLALSADEFRGLPFNIWDWWPLVLVVIGGIMLSRGFGGDHTSARMETRESDVSAFAFWSGIQRRVAAPAFRRGDLTAIMGGIEVDLRPASTGGGEAVVDVFAMWGGIVITVPPDWLIINEVSAVMGGVEDKSTGAPGASNRLVLRGFALMGGIEIKT